MRTFFSTREIAEILGTPEWRIRRLYEIGLIQEPSRFAGKRTIPGNQIPQIVDAMRARGWLCNSPTTTTEGIGKFLPKPTFPK